MDFYEGTIKLMKYELIDQLSDNGYSSSVCFLAEKSGEKFVFKFPNVTDFTPKVVLDKKDVASIRREYEVLKLLRGFPAVSKDVYYSDCCNFSETCDKKCPRSYSPLFLIKVYVPGYELVDRRKIKTENSLDLKNLVLSLHEKGYAGLDLAWPGNVIVDFNGMPWVVDLGSATRIGEKFDDGKRTRLVDRAFFAELRKNDLSDLARVCV
ncbi:MAG TPA: hypothetical protein VI815_01360 [Candidatus Nanoarchaeia archaeon]|nr:hypothetical protein [Candidatus Nanoarchaeia archaeon]